MRGKTVRGWLGLVALVVPLAGVSGQAGAVPAQGGGPHPPAANVERRPAIAIFEGRAIDLARGWDEARACLVWRQGGVLECFRTAEELDARGAQLRPSQDTTTSVAASSYSCSSPLRLYYYTWYGGRQVSFWDRGWWQNLADYGFGDRTSSYVVGACYAHLAEHPDGGGWWYPGPTYPYAGEPVMYSDWQNTISSIFVE